MKPQYCPRCPTQVLIFSPSGNLVCTKCQKSYTPEQLKAHARKSVKPTRPAAAKPVRPAVGKPKSAGVTKSPATRQSSAQIPVTNRTSRQPKLRQAGPSYIILGSILGGLVLVLGLGVFIVAKPWAGKAQPTTPEEKKPGPVALNEPAPIPVEQPQTPIKPKQEEPKQEEPKQKEPNKDPVKKPEMPEVKPDPMEKDPPEQKEKEKDPDIPNGGIVTDGASKLKIKVVDTVMTDMVELGRPLKLAVSRKDFDDIGSVLRSLGDGYDYSVFPDESLSDYDQLKKFDVLFLTCAGSSKFKKDVNSALRKFVEKGGTLYASDLRFDNIWGAFPEYVDPDLAKNGVAQKLKAQVTEPGLKKLLGKEIRLHFDLGGWKPAAFKTDDPDKVLVYLHAKYKAGNFINVEAPLLVKFLHGDGAVIFTSFHNAAQNSETEAKLLKYLVLAAVTAKMERRIQRTMISGGFSPQQFNRIATSLENPKATAVYKHEKAGQLRFVLGFRDAKARLKLTLISPAGEKIEKEDTKGFALEFENAPAGEWTYTITALNVPYPNFPFTLTVGAKKE